MDLLLISLDSFKYQLSAVPCSLSVPSSPIFVYPTACSTAPRGCPLGGRNLRTEPDFLIFPQTCFSDILVNGNSLLHVTQARTLPSLSFLHPVSPLSSTFRLFTLWPLSPPWERPLLYIAEGSNLYTLIRSWCSARMTWQFGTTHLLAVLRLLKPHSPTFVTLPFSPHNSSTTYFSSSSILECGLQTGKGCHLAPWPGCPT